jgi:hypothetical protein
MSLASQTNQGIQILSLENLAAAGYKLAISGTDKFAGESILKKGVQTVTAPKFSGQIAIFRYFDLGEERFYTVVDFDVCRSTLLNR